VRFFRTHLCVGVLWYYYLVVFWAFGTQSQPIKFGQVIHCFSMEQGYTSMDPWRLGSCRAEQLRGCLRFQVTVTLIILGTSALFPRECGVAATMRESEKSAVLYMRCG
jgi:hypothetical protein